MTEIAFMTIMLSIQINSLLQSLLETKAYKYVLFACA